MLKKAIKVSKKVKQRTITDVLGKLMEEVGELAKEVGIHTGYQNRPVGADGIKGEVADCANCLFDILYLHDPNMTKKQARKEFKKIFGIKLKKWKNKCKE